MDTAVRLTVVMVLLVTGCSTTQQVTVRDEPGICAFLGEVCHELQPGAQGEAGLRWVNPRSDLTRYHQVLVEVVCPENLKLFINLTLFEFLLMLTQRAPPSSVMSLSGGSDHTPHHLGSAGKRCRPLPVSGITVPGTLGTAVSIGSLPTDG